MHFQQDSCAKPQQLGVGTHTTSELSYRICENLKVTPSLP